MSPWELLEQPFAWLEWAEAAALAENESQKQINEAASRKKK